MNPPVIIGIDPGLTGAITALDAATGTIIWCEDMPTLDKRVNAPVLADLLRDEVIVVAAVENVHAMPKQGVSSVFTFGHGLGVIHGVLGTLGAPVRNPTPQAWKRSMSVTADKASSRTRATEHWPTWADRFKRVKDDGRAESALIARWAWTIERAGATC